MFAAWKNLKHVILMHVLNTTFKQIMIMKIQKTIFNYVKILKMRLNSTVKVVLKWIECEIMILWYECLSLDKEEIKSVKIVKTVNIKIKDNDKEKIIMMRKLFSEDIVLMLNSAETKNYMMKKISWATALKSKTCVIRTHFMIMIKHVIKNAIS